MTFLNDNLQVTVMYIFVLLFLIYNSLISCEIVIKDYGVSHVSRGDVGMVFYVIAENKSKKRYVVDVEMVKCVESITPREQYDDIKLIGGHMGFLDPWATKKLTLIYPNMYLYNRKGVCTVGVCVTNEHRNSRTIPVRIPYGSLAGEAYMPKETKDLYRGISVEHCGSPDLDPFEDCLPIDCLMKYSGNRNYFNEKYKRCEEVVACVSETDEENPTTVYLPTSNTCKRASDCIRESELSGLQEGLGPNCTNHIMQFRMLNLRCNHGVMDNTTGTCICEPGWSSGDTEPDRYVPSLSVYHMCNIEVDSWTEANKVRIRNTILAFMILAVFITISVLLMTFCLYGLYTYISAYEDTYQDELSSEGDFDFIDKSSDNM